MVREWYTRVVERERDNEARSIGLPYERGDNEARHCWSTLLVTAFQHFLLVSHLSALPAQSGVPARLHFSERTILDGNNSGNNGN